MSKILWVSNAPWGQSGYGEQTALFLPRLKALDHDVAVLANWGVNSKVDTWQGFTVYPTDNDWGNRSLTTWVEKHQADIVIMLCDAFILRPHQWEGDFEVAVWAPVDHHPLPPPVGAVLHHERIRPIAMSQFGGQMMLDAELEPLYVPHGIDTKVFNRRPEERDAARDALGVPRDAFLVGMVAANKSGGQQHRKSFDEAFDAFARFAHERPDAWLYVHADAKQAGGWPLDMLAEFIGVPEGRKRFPSPEAWQMGIPAGVLSTIYQAFDVLLAPSRGEGFGIPILEAQASGVPVITSNHSAMTELCHAGWLVDGQRKPAFADNHLPIGFQFQPFIHSIVECLEAAYEARNDEALKASAVEFAQGYDANRVTLEYWVPTLDALGASDPVIESRQVRRARERREAKVTA